jgi:hypothetical protein
MAGSNIAFGAWERPTSGRLKRASSPPWRSGPSPEQSGKRCGHIRNGIPRKSPVKAEVRTSRRLGRSEEACDGVIEQPSRHAPAARLGPQDGRSHQQFEAWSSWLVRPEYPPQSIAFLQRACANAQHHKSKVSAPRGLCYSKKLRSRPGASWETCHPRTEASSAWISKL